MFGYGDVWTWVALDADTKLVPSWRVGPRDLATAYDYMHDLAGRLKNRVQLTTDGFKVYLEAVESAFYPDVDYAMLQKVRGRPRAAAPLQSRQGAEHQYGGHNRQHQPKGRFNVVRRAPESHHANEHETVHQINQRVQQETREPCSVNRALLHALQFLPGSQDAADHARGYGRART